MKKYIYILISSLILCCLAFYIDPYIETKIDVEKVKELANISHPIRTINPADTNYQDLAFLKDKLQGVDMVMLGEQSHGDGSAFLAKSRLIQFLHQEMDFEVLLFESGIYDCFNLWEEISGIPAKLPDDFNRALFYFWGGSNETKDLRKYITQHAKSPHPIFFGGFDIQNSGNIREPKRLELIASYLSKRGINFEKEFKNLAHIIENYQHYKTAYASKELPASKKQAIFNEIEQLSIILAKSVKTNEDQLFIRYVSCIQEDLKSNWLYQGNDEKQNIIRDSMMAENVIWLKDHLHKNKKIIVWAANSHILHHTQYLKDSPFYYKRMGTYLQDKYGRSCYSINFTSYSGNTCNIKSGAPQRINTSIGNGLESMLHDAGNPFAFIDFRTIPKNSFLNKATTMKFLGHDNCTEQWSKMMDGMFFIDQMKPITFN